MSDISTGHISKFTNCRSYCNAEVAIDHLAFSELILLL